MKVRHRDLFLCSMVLLAGFGYSAISRLLFLARAERDVAVVREVRTENGRCGGKRRYDCTKFFATVEIRSSRGRQSSRIDAGHTRKHDQPVWKALFQPGDHVPVVFDPERPEKIHRDKLWDLWGPSLVLLILQVCLLAASLHDPELSEPVTLKLNEGS